MNHPARTRSPSTTRHAATGRAARTAMAIGTTLLALLGLLATGTARAQATEGEVRKIDKAMGKVTLRHGEIVNLKMPAMTMVFRVDDAKLLDGLSEGTAVRFDAELRNGLYFVTRIKAVK